MSIEPLLLDVVVIKEGGEDTAFQSALLIGLGAVAATVITAVAAQLRLKATLRGERDRLGDQLAHDRHMSDLVDLRERFDSATETAEEALYAITSAAASLLTKSPDKTAIRERLLTASDHGVTLAIHVQRGWGRLGSWITPEGNGSRTAS